MRRADKLAALCRILDVEDPSSALVFARTRGEVDDLAEALSSRGHDAGALHGGLAQEARDRVMGRFRDGTLDVLVATDVAARGLDIDHVSHVVNYDVPSDPDAYVHRIGRTGRAGREGAALTLVEPREHRLLRNIESATRTKLQIARLPTVADLRERRLEILRANLREALVAGDHERLRGVVEPLTEEFDLVEIALAAVSLIEGAERREDDEIELAPAILQAPAPGHAGAGRSAAGRAADRAAGRAVAPPADHVDRCRAAAPRDAPVAAVRGSSCSSAAAVVPASARATWSARSRTRRACRAPWSARSRSIDDFALVDVQASVADAVAHALRGATIRGQKLAVRRERP